MQTRSSGESMMKSPIFLLITMAAAVLNATPAATQSYPSKPVRIITANSDVFVRALADELQKRWAQPVIIENRSGGGMNIAGRACADAPNDGYTICILPNETLTLNQFTYRSIPFDPAKDFEPITNAFINTQVLVVSAALNVSSLDELAALSKAKPGTLSYSALGHSHADHHGELEGEDRRRSHQRSLARRRRHCDRYFDRNDAGGDRRLAQLHRSHPQRHGESAGRRFTYPLSAISRRADPE